MILNLKGDIMEDSVRIIKELGIELPKNIYNYALIRKRFASLAKDKADEFEANFYSTFSDMDDLANNCLTHGVEIIITIIELAVDKLVSMGLYDLNSDLFATKYVSKYFEWENDFNKLFNHYVSICMTEEDEIKYREKRKESRSKWGVLFSSGDYSKDLSNEFDAGVRNVVEGIGHSIFNAIGDAISRSVAKNEKVKLFSNPETLKYLRDSLYRTCFNVHYAFCDVLLESGDKKIISISSLIEKEQYSNRLLDNLQSERIPESEVLNVLKTIILSYPFNPNIYSALSSLKLFSKIDLFEFAHFFSIDISDLLFSESISDIKRNIEDYDLEKRKKLYKEFEELGVTDTDLDSEVQKLKELVLFYNEKQFKSFDEIKKYLSDQELEREEKLKQEAKGRERELEEQKANSDKILNVFQVYKSQSSIYVQEIPAKKDSNARNKFNIPYEEKIIVLIDFTLGDSAKNGIAFCLGGIYCRSERVKSFLPYNDLSEIISVRKSFYGVNIDILHDDRIELDLSGSSFKGKDLVNAINELVREFTGKNIDFQKDSKSTPTSDEIDPESNPTSDKSDSESTPTSDKSDSESTPTSDKSDSESTPTSDKSDSESTPTSDKSDPESTPTSDKSDPESTSLRNKSDSERAPKRYKLIVAIFVLIYVIIFPVFTIISFSGSDEGFLSTIIYFPVTMLFNYLVAKEKGRSVVFWLLMSFVPFSALILTFLKHTPKEK